jgi:hypothetical protein
MPGPLIDPKDYDKSIVKTPKASDGLIPGSNIYTYFVSSVADWVEPWGRNWQKRDQQLRDFFPTESFVAGAIFSIAAANANFRWEIDGPPRTTEQIRVLINTANRGKGWINFAQKLSIDLLTQDNGAFIEFIRQGKTETSPVIGIATLDAARCMRTGDPLEPVIYIDRDNVRHLMKWFQVCPISECPSSIESMYDMQYSGLTRVLKMAQILKDLTVYKAEKVGGRFEKSIHIVGGPSKADLENVLERDHNRASEQGLTRFMLPTILASLDPEKPVSHVEIPLASLPENFSFDEEMKWYLAALALGFGRDYQDFAPLPGGGLGTSAQSEIMHMKSKAKGPALFMRILEYVLNFYGVMPATTTFKFEEIDPNDDKLDADTAKVRAETRAVQITSGEIDARMARQMAADIGDIDESILSMAGEIDVTDNATVEDNEPVDEGEDVKPANVKPMEKPVKPVEKPTEKPAPQKFWSQVFSPKTLKDLIGKMMGTEEKGGEGSGNFDHLGRPGLVGGSGPGGSFPGITHASGGESAGGSARDIKTTDSGYRYRPKMTYEQFAELNNGSALGYSRPEFNRMPRVTDANRRRAGNTILENSSKLSSLREKLNDVYDNLVVQGLITAPSRIDELIDVARGMPDNESVQAARRLLTKRGISW